MEEQKIKVYVKVNGLNEIVDINSDIFIDDLSGWIKIDEGFGDRYAHAQGLYLPEPIMDDQGRYNFFLNRGKVMRAAW